MEGGTATLGWLTGLTEESWLCQSNCTLSIGNLPNLVECPEKIPIPGHQEGKLLYQDVRIAGHWFDDHSSG